MKRTKTEERILRALRDKVQFKRAHFRVTSEQIERLKGSILNSGSPEPTNVIREATETYVHSWILPLIDALLSGDARTIREAARYCE